MSEQIVPPDGSPLPEKKEEQPKGKTRTKSLGINTANWIEVLPKELQNKVVGMDRKQRRKWFRQNRKKLFG